RVTTSDSTEEGGEFKAPVTGELAKRERAGYDTRADEEATQGDQRGAGHGLSLFHPVASPSPDSVTESDTTFALGTRSCSFALRLSSASPQAPAASGSVILSGRGGRCVRGMRRLAVHLGTGGTAI